MYIRHNEAQNQFEAFSQQGKKMGYLHYVPKGDVLATDHTVVDPVFGGQGVATRLLEAAAEWAQKENKHIEPVCPFIAKAFQKEPEKYRAVMLP